MKEKQQRNISILESTDFIFRFLKEKRFLQFIHVLLLCLLYYELKCTQRMQLCAIEVVDVSGGGGRGGVLGEGGAHDKCMHVEFGWI